MVGIQFLTRDAAKSYIQSKSNYLNRQKLGQKNNLFQ